MSTDRSPDAIPIAAPVHGELPVNGESPVLGYAGAVDVKARRRWLTIVLWLGAIATFAAPVCIAAIDVESVLVTGPLIAALGLATVFVAARVGDVEAMIVGAIQLLACIGAFTMVWWNGWGPEPSRGPLMIVSGVCCLVVAAFVVRRLQVWSMGL